MAIKTITYDDVQSQGSGFKHEETTRNIVLHLLNEYGDPVRPDSSHKWVAKVSDGNKYVGDFKVKIDNTDIVVDSEDFTQLPPNAINEAWATAQNEVDNFGKPNTTKLTIDDMITLLNSKN